MKMTDKTLAELRALPLMLGKALGGIAAVAGFGLAVFAATRSPQVAAGVSPLVAFIVGVLGLLTFVICGRGLSQRPPPAAEPETASERRQTSTMAWGLLLLLVLLFLGALFVLA